jgi:hypothetical protein
VANPDLDREANQAIVEAAREELRRAAVNLTPEVEAAAIYSLAPHAFPETLSDEDAE